MITNPVIINYFSVINDLEIKLNKSKQLFYSNLAKYRELIIYDQEKKIANTKINDIDNEKKISDTKINNIDNEKKYDQHVINIDVINNPKISELNIRYDTISGFYFLLKTIDVIYSPELINKIFVNPKMNILSAMLFNVLLDYNNENNKLQQRFESYYFSIPEMYIKVYNLLYDSDPILDIHYKPELNNIIGIKNDDDRFNTILQIISRLYCPIYYHPPSVKKFKLDSKSIQDKSNFNLNLKKDINQFSENLKNNTLNQTEFINKIKNVIKYNTQNIDDFINELDKNLDFLNLFNVYKISITVNNDLLDKTKNSPIPTLIKTKTYKIFNIPVTTSEPITIQKLFDDLLFNIVEKKISNNNILTDEDEKKMIKSAANHICDLGNYGILVKDKKYIYKFIGFPVNIYGQNVFCIKILSKNEQKCNINSVHILNVAIYDYIDKAMKSIQMKLFGSIKCNNDNKYNCILNLQDYFEKDAIWYEFDNEKVNKITLQYVDEFCKNAHYLYYKYELE